MSRHDTGIVTSALRVGEARLEMFRVADLPGTDRLPVCLRLLAENLIRHADRADLDAAAITDLLGRTGSDADIDFYPGRILMHDLSGIPALLDLAALRDVVARRNPAARPPQPQLPIDFVIDHSVVARAAGGPDALAANATLDLALNAERYDFLRWAAAAFDRLRLLPPNRGICHQVNLETLATVVSVTDGLARPDTVLGTDSHTPMINALGVLGWGVGGIEAEAALLGLPVTMHLPRVVGVRITGEPALGTTATDIGLTINQRLRAHGVVNTFVEFTGPGLDRLPLASRATISNMSPEYGSTCALFPIDEQTLQYLRLTGRSPHHVAVVEAYAKEQGLWRGDELTYSTVLEIDLGQIEPSLAGPSRPDQRIGLAGLPAAVASVPPPGSPRPIRPGPVKPATDTPDLAQGAVVLAAITSCTNTSNPQVMVGAGLVARRAHQRGLRVAPWTKATLAPGSTTVTTYLEAAGLMQDLNDIGFWLVGYGCTTCMGNSGDLLPAATARSTSGNLAAVLSGNRNFPGRIHPDVAMNFLASPPLVVAYALAGTMDINLTTQPLGIDKDGAPVWLAELWPAEEEIAAVIAANVHPAQFLAAYADLADASGSGCEPIPFDWDDASDYLRRPPFFDDHSDAPWLDDLHDARALVVAGDSVPTDHISPAGAIRRDSAAGAYLTARGVPAAEFNSFGARRGNHHIMARGTFANRWFRNALVPDEPGGMTRVLPDGPVTTVFDAAEEYRRRDVPLVVLAGRDYGAGSSRDWAAKGPSMLGVRAVLARSYERIHRSNLIGLGIVPLEFGDGDSIESLGLDITAPISIVGLSDHEVPDEVEVTIGAVRFQARLGAVTATERRYLRDGGILRHAARRFCEPPVPAD